MGGHEPWKIPHHSSYANWQRIPDLVEYNKRLGRLGLTDPFIRNYVFKYDPASGAFLKTVKNSVWLSVFKLIKPGFYVGFFAATAVITIEESYTYYKYGYTSWTHKKH